MLLDLSPLRRHRDFRLLFIGQLVSAFGSFFTVVAMPVQIYALTKSSAIVGLLGTVQLVPLAITALWGGAVADAIDRRRLLLGSEALLLLLSATLAVDSFRPHPSVALLFVVAGLMSAVNGFHTPALQALTPRLVPKEELPAISALGSIRGTMAMIAGPALAGVTIATLGMSFTFALDASTFAVSLVALSMMKSIPPAENAPKVGFGSIIEGLRYALSRPVLVGTYVVDIVAMTFAMPFAVFPELASGWGNPGAAGYLFASLSFGAFVVSVFSAWTKHVKRQGAAVILAATGWGLSIIALGYAPNVWIAAGCLALAGAADSVSGLFRMTIWNETIDDRVRGRLAGIEQLSYMSGPLLGNARAGFMAARFGVQRSISWGGMLCVLFVLALIPLLPAFWRYVRLNRSESAATDRSDSPPAA